MQGQAAALQPAFDGALSEQCNQYRECASFAPYLAAGKPVLNAEYHLSTSRFCAADAAAGIVGARFNLALNGRLFTPCGGYPSAAASACATLPAMPRSIARRVRSVALPICGSMTVRGAASSRGEIAGSPS